jgi:DNA repair protein RadC
MATATISRRQQVGSCRPRRRGDATILRAMAILRERLREPGEVLGSPGQVRAFLMLHLAELEHEAFMVLFLDAHNRLIEARELFRGTLTQTSVYPREVVRAALAANAAAVIFAHNHPSGCAEPSAADELLTRNLKTSLAMVDVRVTDHFIVAGNAYPLSFAERGLL